MSATVPHIRLVDVLHVGLQKDASDIHFVPGLCPALRVDGELQFLTGSPLTAEDTMEIARALLEPEALARLETGDDVSATRLPDERLVLRIHAFRGSQGCTLALRLLNKSIPTLESLHLPAVVATLGHHDRGLVIFAGPTGSGKSTSLAALIAEINASSARRIITIEDPINTATKALDRSSHSVRSVGTRDHSARPWWGRSARIRTSSWSGRCAMAPPCERPLPRPKPDISCLQRSIRGAPSKRSSVSSMRSAARSNHRCGRNSRSR